MKTNTQLSTIFSQVKGVKSVNILFDEQESEYRVVCFKNGVEDIYEECHTTCEEEAKGVALNWLE